MRNAVMDVITFPVNLKTTSGLSILLHGVILLPGATSYDKLDREIVATFYCALMTAHTVVQCDICYMQP